MAYSKEKVVIDETIKGMERGVCKTPLELMI